MNLLSKIDLIAFEGAGWLCIFWIFWDALVCASSNFFLTISAFCCAFEIAAFCASAILWHAKMSASFWWLWGLRSPCFWLDRFWSKTCISGLMISTLLPENMILFTIWSLPEKTVRLSLVLQPVRCCFSLAYFSGMHPNPKLFSTTTHLSQHYIREIM